MSARRMMVNAGIRHLPIVDDGRLVGIVSDRDVSVTDPPIAAGLTLLQSELLWGRYRLVATVMSRPVVISPDAPLSEAAATLRRRRIGALPVAEEGQLVGIISTYDCLAALERGAFPPR
jgi:acetoin utilization protein AcuB